jgi:M6 family metalloprotease-like protein
MSFKPRNEVAQRASAEVLPMLKIVQGLVIAALLSFTTQLAHGINASPEPVEVRQPDGTKLMLQVRGDERFHWFEDMKGFPVIKDAGNQYVYSIVEPAGKLVPTALLVGQADPVIAGIVSKAMPSAEQIRTMTALAEDPSFDTPNFSGPPQQVAARGMVKNLVILCKFADHTFGTHTRQQADYNVLFNNVGSNATLAPTGSVKDYFQEASYGTMSFQSTVIAWVTLPNSEAYYANGSDGTGGVYPRNAQGMVKDALDVADSLVNFAEFDQNNDGFVDAITILHSGYGAETGGGNGNWIWSHKWSLWQVAGGRWTSHETNGVGVPVKVYDYHTEPALWGTSGTAISHVGVICHETGHFFGLPDLYDTDNSSSGIGSWCLMANSWGFDGSQLHPPHPSAWCKAQLGWVTPTVISSGSQTAARVETSQSIFKVTSGFPAGEYLLVENRQPYGFESIIPQGGLAIWHIDENKAKNTDEGYPGQSGWPANGLHYKVALLQADGLYQLEKGIGSGNASDLYRGGGVAAISPLTVPSTNRYQSGIVASTNNTITNISASGTSMSFTLNNTSVSKANLTFYTPAGWTDKVIVSNVTGTNTDSVGLSPKDSLYVDFAPWNNGEIAVPTAWSAKIYVDGVVVMNHPFPAGLGSNYYYSNEFDNSIGSLPPGVHILKIVLDSDNAVSEASEGDNEFQKTIVIASPNLTFYKPPGWSDAVVVSAVKGTIMDSPRLVSTDNLYVDLAPWNNGDAKVAVGWNAKIYVDGIERHNTAFATVLSPNYYFSSVFDKPIGAFLPGVHTVKVVLDTGNTVMESNEGDNIYQRSITVYDVPGKVSFGNSLMLVSEESGIVYVPLVRSSGNEGAVTVSVSSANGTAKAPGDFTSLSNAVVSFASGQTSASVPVTINRDTIGEVSETFTLRLTSPTGGASLGALTTTTVRIIDFDDSVRPSVAITWPAVNGSFREGMVTTTGKAADTNRISKVQVSLNGGSFMDATTTVTTTGLTATFTAPLAPLPGSNLLTVRSQDWRGNFSLTHSHTFFSVVLRPLVVSVSPSDAGTLTAPFPGIDTNRKVNYNYTLTATPRPGHVFSGWTANSMAGTGITVAKAELPTLTFTHQAGLVLTAHFIHNPFIPALIGTFNGLAIPSTSEPVSTGTKPGLDTVGFLQNAVVTSTGAFTSTLKIDGRNLTVVGKLDIAGVARFGTNRSTSLAIARTGKPSLEVDLRLDMTGTSGKITGSVQQKVLGTLIAKSLVDADRARGSGIGPLAKPYTLVFPARATQASGLAANHYPQGAGYATMMVNTNGVVTMSGKVADHTAITSSAPLSKLNKWPIFAQLYSLKGCIAGSAMLMGTDSVTPTTMRWFRPFQNTQWYPDGWSSGILVDLVGSEYVVPAAPPAISVFPGLLATTPNATLSFSLGQLSPAISKDVTISPTNLVTNSPVATSPTFVITRTTGLISGSFTHQDGSKPAFQGVILQKGATKGASGYFMTVSPKVPNYLGESGAVQVTAKP